MALIQCECGKAISDRAERCPGCGKKRGAAPPYPDRRQHSTARCPYCHEEIRPAAKKCKHCGEWLTPEMREPRPPSPPPQPQQPIIVERGGGGCGSGCGSCLVILVIVFIVLPVLGFMFKWAIIMKLVEDFIEAFTGN